MLAVGTKAPSFTLPDQNENVLIKERDMIPDQLAVRKKAL